MTLYAKVSADRSQIIEVGSRPSWIVDGEPASDAVLSAGGYRTDADGNPAIDSEGRRILATDQPGWLPLVSSPAPEFSPLLSTLRQQRRDEWAIEQDRVVSTWVVEPNTFITSIVLLTQRMDAMAEDCRDTFLTRGGPGQALEYDETRREVDAWRSDPDPKLDDYPMLRAEYNARRASDPSVTADGIVTETEEQVALWRQVGAAIKEVRRTGKVAAEAATKPARLLHIEQWAEAAFRSISETGIFDALSSDTTSL